MTEINLKLETEHLLRRFIWTGSVMHYVDPKAPMSPDDTEERRPALCGIKPWWPTVWWGVDDSAEYFDAERGKELTDCQGCLRALIVTAISRGESGAGAQ